MARQARGDGERRKGEVLSPEPVRLSRSFRQLKPLSPRELCIPTAKGREDEIVSLKPIYQQDRIGRPSKLYSRPPQKRVLRTKRRL